jgi:hypothetical protein
MHKLTVVGGHGSNTAPLTYSDAQQQHLPAVTAYTKQQLMAS